MLLVALPQLADPGNTAALLAVNALLGCLALLAFHRVARRLVPEEERASSLLPGLATLAFALHPVFLAGAVFLTPDYGVAVFFLVALAGLLEGRIGWAVIAGTFAVWSKQPGVVVYTLAAFAWIALRLASSPGSLRAALYASRRLAWLLLPTASFVLYPFLKHWRLIGQTFYEADGGPGLVATALAPGSHRVLLGYLVLVFVLNGAWLATSFALAGAVKALAGVRLRPLAGLRERLLGSEVSRDRLVVVLTLLSGTAVLTRFPTFLNTRYFLPLYPLLVLSGMAALHSLARSRAVRAVAMGTVGLLFGLSIWRTTDPVSRAVFGTFRFGEHEMLKMTSLTGECCGYGRDQLVYSLEFARFHDLANEMLPALVSRPRPPLVSWPDLDWHFLGPIDRVTARRTLRRGATVPVRVRSVIPFARGDASATGLVLLEFPNFARESPLRYLLRFYEVESWMAFDASGYRADAIQLRRRLRVAPLPPPLPAE